MNLAVAQKPRVLEAGDETKDAGLLAELQVILKSDEVVAVGAEIFFSQLDHGPRPYACSWIAETDGLHRAEAQGIAAAAGEDLDGQAAFKVIELFPFL